MFTSISENYDRVARSTASSASEGRLKEDVGRNRKLRKTLKLKLINKRDGHGGCGAKKK